MTSASKKQALIDAEQRLMDDLRHLEKCADSALFEMEKLKKVSVNQNTFHQITRTLDRIDTEIMNISSRNVAGFLLQSTIDHAVQHQGKGKTPVQILESSENIYRKLKDSVQFHRKSLAKTFKVMRD